MAYKVSEGVKSMYHVERVNEPTSKSKGAGMKIENMTMLSLAEHRIEEKITSMSTLQLLDLWDETEKKVITTHLAAVRGAIMNLLDYREHASFEAWMGNVCEPYHKEKDSPRFYFEEDAKLRQSNVDDYNAIFGI